MKTIFTLLFFVLTALTSAGQSKAEKQKLAADKAAIKSMAGCYKVTFDFAETFSPVKDYQYGKRKSEWGIEYVFIVKETETEISLQHLLIVNDSTIIKHWRQDWVYENTRILSYQKDNSWNAVELSPKQAKGTWTQKVFQVDDSPRYESYGSWNHVDGRHFWESTADAPLPRREFTIRSDYNVLRRHSRVELTSYGWILEQDNEKINRSAGGDSLLCWEKGFERFLTGNYDCSAAIRWWDSQSQYWADVRSVWDEVLKSNDAITLQKRVDNKLLFQQLFSKGDELAGVKDYKSNEVKAVIKDIIQQYLKS